MISKILTLLVITLLAVSCSTNVAGAGTGTSTGNPIIIGIAVATDGSPMRNCPVHVEALDMDTTQWMGEEFDSTGSLMTDGKGQYRFSIARPGIFCVEVRDEEKGIAIRDSLVVNNRDSVISTDTITAIPVDTLSGNIDLGCSYYGNAAITVSLKGSNQKCTLSSGGAFTLYPAKGIYTLIISSDNSSFTPETLSNIASNSILGTIKLYRETDTTSEDIDTTSEDIDTSSSTTSRDYHNDSLCVRYILNINGKKDVPVEAVTVVSGTPSRITGLTLTGKGFHYLPMVVGLLEKLQSLTITDTKITSIPSKIANCTELTTLNLSNNVLVKLPVNIKNLLSISQLDVSGNYLVVTDTSMAEWLNQNDPDWKSTQQW